MKKPSPAAIKSAVPLSQLTERPADPLRGCNVCGRDVDPTDPPLTVWREHDEYDRPIPGPSALVFLGSGRDHAACRKRLDAHARLYAEEPGQPGYFPELCGSCVHRAGLECNHADLRANGGAGLAITLDAAQAIICSRGSGCHTPVRHAVKCVGRQTYEDAPYVCPGCHAVGEEPCAPGCVDAEIARELQCDVLYARDEDWDR